MQPKHILVTRPQHQADALIARLTACGAIPHAFPLLEIIDQRLDIASLQNNLQDGFDYLIFVSPNAVAYGLLALPSHWLLQAKIAAIGKKTAKALQTQGIDVDLYPEQGFDSEHFLAMPKMQQLQGCKVLIIRGVGGRELLADTLRSRGATVAYAEVYARRCPRFDVSLLKNQWMAEQLDIIIISSIESLQNLYQQSHRQLGAEEGWHYQPDLLLGSKRMLKKALEMGHQGSLHLAANPSDEAVIDALRQLHYC